MELIRSPRPQVQSLGILPGAFNPPTLAHLALAEASLKHVDAVLLALPGVLPHKSWEGATREERREMLRIITQGNDRLGAAVSEGGLFIEMVREARVYFPAADLHLICGRDAAERIVGWDYGEADAIEKILTEFRLLVAPRGGQYRPPEHIAHAVQSLDLSCWDECSSTEVRRGGIDLVPEGIKGMVSRIYW